MLTGCITRYRADTGYGFIAPDDGGPDVFLHASALRSMQEKIKDGTAVSYRVETDPDTGLRSAVNIQLLGARCKPAKRRRDSFAGPSRAPAPVESAQDEPTMSVRVFPPPQKRSGH
jgi:CspA family cold shock protein